MAVTPAKLVNFLKKQASAVSGLEYLKLVYRPLICPFDELLSLIKPKARVLDIGCGAGQFLSLVAAFSEPAALAGLEIKPELTAQASRLLSAQNPTLPVSIREFDGLHFPGFLTEFDTVFLIDVLHHVPVQNQETFLRNLYAALSPGTTFILKDIDAASPWVYFNKLHDLVVAKEIGNELSMANTAQLAEEIGFNLLFSRKKRLLGYPHFTLVLQKK